VAGASTTFACNGAKGSPGAPGAPGAPGSPWTAGGTLPVGSTETGTWSFFSTPQEAGNTYYSVSLSFNIPLAAGLDSSHVHYSSDANFGTFCTGTPAEPTAPSGELCVYETESLRTHKNVIAGPGGSAGASPAGAFVQFVQEEEEPWFAKGSWAVTG
jgi:hypothetical protein